MTDQDAHIAGYILENGRAVVLAQDLGLALAKRVSGLQQTRRICPARVSACHFVAEGARLTLATAEGKKHLSARLVVAADGTDSCIRKAAGIATHTHDYGQTLFVSSLMADQVSDGTAYERFSGQGPVALLPMADGAYGAICAVPADDAARVSDLLAAAGRGAHGALHLGQQFKQAGG